MKTVASHIYKMSRIQSSIARSLSLQDLSRRLKKA